MDGAVDEALLRALTPTVIGVLGRRGADFAAAEDAVQEALVEAVRVWPDDPPRDPQAWLVTVAWRRFLDAVRADTSRRRREVLVDEEPAPGPTAVTDDTLQLYFLCAHPSLTPASAVALTLRAVGGLTTRQIAQAYLVPEATMAQRISRAKRTVVRRPVRPARRRRHGAAGALPRLQRGLLRRRRPGRRGHPADPAAGAGMTTPRGGRAARADAAAPRAASRADPPRRRPRAAGGAGPHAWDTGMITEGVEVLQAALARDRLGEYQAQAAVAALHADAPVGRGDRLGADRRVVRRAGAPHRQPGVRLNRAVAVGEADGARAGLAALAELDPSLPRYAAVAAYLHERDGDRAAAARLYAEAARTAPTLPEREHLTRQAARLNAGLRR